MKRILSLVAVALMAVTARADTWEKVTAEGGGKQLDAQTYGQFISVGFTANVEANTTYTVTLAVAPDAEDPDWSTLYAVVCTKQYTTGASGTLWGSCYADDRALLGAATGLWNGLPDSTVGWSYQLIVTKTSGGGGGPPLYTGWCDKVDQ